MAPRVYPFASASKRPQARPPDNGESPTTNTAQHNIEAIVRLEQDALTQRTFGERLADLLAGVATQPWFFFAHATVLAVWMLGNSVGSWRLDPPPFYALSTTIAVESIFVTLLVLASQQRMARVSERRAHLNLQVDLLAEQEMTLMLRMLERLFEHFKLEPVCPLPESAELKQPTDVEDLVNKLDRTMEQREAT
jgi:uncharacterized membrane protein